MARALVLERLAQPVQVRRRGHECPAQTAAQLKLQLVQLVNMYATALRHKEVGVEDIICGLGGH